MKIDGGCHCGNITYEADIDPDRIIMCHCTDCQKLSATAFRVVVQVSEDKFTLLKAKPKIYMKTAENGNPREQAFCAECGSQIYASTPDEGSGDRLIGLRLGTCNQRHELTPSRQLWTRSALPWIDKIGMVPKFETSPNPKGVS
jgi:hypothetical protein